ncbi:O-antigen ligase family protein [Glaciecola sp. SC05]|uniref:O-antigen ligase family protein n=1 Tax=Glaciecola sp. SC05 TaxID=1987355 RepID=UPI003527D24B
MRTIRNFTEKHLSVPFYIFLAILFLLPIPLGSNRPWAWSFFQIAIFALTFFTTFKLRETKDAGVHRYKSMVLLWIVFIVIALLQITPLPVVLIDIFSPSSSELYRLAGAETFYLSIDHGQSMISFIKLLSLFCLLLLTMQLINSETRIKLLLLTMLASGTFQALYGSLEILLGATESLVFGFEVKEFATGSFVYKNHYANFLMLCLCAGIGLIVTSLEKDKMMSPKDKLRSIASSLLSSKAIIRICLAVMVIGLVMSRSRMGNAAFFVSVAIVGLISLILIRNRSTGLFIFVVSMFIVDLFIVSAYFGLARVKERLEQTTLSDETRDEVVQDAFPIIADFPLFGSGGGSFYSIFPSYQKLEVFDFYDHAHNDFLQFTIEFGVSGVFILFIILLFTLYKALRAMYMRKNSIFKGASFAVAMAVLGMSMHMTVDFPLQGFANASYFVVFIGLAMVANGLKIRRIKSTNKERENRF